MWPLKRDDYHHLKKSISTDRFTRIESVRTERKEVLTRETKARRTKRATARLKDGESTGKSIEGRTARARVERVSKVTKESLQ